MIFVELNDQMAVEADRITLRLINIGEDARIAIGLLGAIYLESRKAPDAD